jgi:hypothetical protein
MTSFVVVELAEAVMLLPRLIQFVWDRSVEYCT